MSAPPVAPTKLMDERNIKYFPFTKDGETKNYTAEQVEEILLSGVTVQKLFDGDETYHCPLCDKTIASIGGFGPHSRAHREAVGLAPKRKPVQAKPQKAPAPPTRSKEARPTVEEGCLALISAVTGRKTVPLEQIPDVYVWIEATKVLMREIK